MVTWTREETIALISLATALLAAVAGTLALTHPRAKFVLLVLLGITALGSFASIRVGRPSGGFTEEDVRREQEEIEAMLARRHAAAREARDRIDREARARSVADSIVRDSIARAEAEREARERIAREQAVREARERIERETAQRETAIAAELLIGKWATGAVSIEITRDGRILKFGLDSRYRVVAADSFVETTWCCSFPSKIIALSADSMIFDQGGIGGDITWRRVP